MGDITDLTVCELIEKLDKKRIDIRRNSKSLLR